MDNNNKPKKFTTKYIKDNAQINIYFDSQAINAHEIITALNEYDKLKEDYAALLENLKKLTEMQEESGLKMLFDKRQLSRTKAKVIAESQHDLGGKSQIDMAIALGGVKEAKTNEELLSQRMEAFNRLDPLSKLIVTYSLEADSYEECVNDLNYAAFNISAAAKSLEE